MKRQNHIVFALSKVGAAHVPAGKPCQDFSLKMDEDGVRMVVVCDGHGSRTYVRSDTGARLAAEVTREAVMDFVAKTPPELFRNKKGAVTARPTAEDIMRGAETKSSAALTEAAWQNIQQNRAFLNQVRDILEQDIVILTLLRRISSAWLRAIKEHCLENPLSEEEKKALGNKPLAKAYGTTLMAYVETPDYWLAFHIGDGRIIAVDQNMEMKEPVPWDCNCFLNVTTSLCSDNPVSLFRYAFDGTGRFPAAVFCCSDGIEDSYGDYELAPYFLHEWYAGLLSEFHRNGEAQTLERMDEFFTLLSQKGSRDDVSLAGIIDTAAIAKSLGAADIKSKIMEIDSKAEDLSRQMEDLGRQKSELEQKLTEMEQETEETAEEATLPDNTLQATGEHAELPPS